MASSASQGEIIDEFLSRKYERLHIASPETFITDLAKSIESLNFQIHSYLTKYKNIDDILLLKEELSKFSNAIRDMINKVNNVVFYVDIIIKDKRSKIDRKLGYIFEKFLTKGGILGKNKSEAFLGYLLDIKKQANTFLSFLEELYKEPLLTETTENLLKEQSRFDDYKYSLSKNITIVKNSVMGGTGPFVHNIEIVFSIWDAFFSRGNAIKFEEICATFKNLNDTALKFNEKLKKLEKKLNSNAKQHLSKILSIQNQGNIVNTADLKKEYGEKDASVMVAAAKMYNFHSSFNDVKIDLMTYAPGEIKEKNALKTIELLDKYLKLSAELEQIMNQLKPKKSILSWFFGGDETQNEQTSKSSILIWMLIIIVGVVIIIMILLWKNDEIITGRAASNFTPQEGLYFAT